MFELTDEHLACIIYSVFNVTTLNIILGVHLSRYILDIGVGLFVFVWSFSSTTT